MNKAELTAGLKAEAARLGFVLAGVTTPDPPASLPRFENWLAAGRQGPLGYLARPDTLAARRDPRALLPECESILVVAVPYSRPAGAAEPGRGRVAAYAWQADYHKALPPRLAALVAWLEGQTGAQIPHRILTDSGPVLERDLAQRAGLGWIGKNSMLIHPQHGSTFLLAEVLLGVELEPDTAMETDHCGTCIRCIEACPTDCILPDRTLDAGRCISTLTIELKTAIPPDLRPLMGDWVFGCDICQQVCPWNERFAPPEGDPAFTAVEAGRVQPRLVDELALGPEEFKQTYGATPLARPKRAGYLRNVAVALGNVGGAAAVPALVAALGDAEPLVRGHAAWALGRIGGAAARAALGAALGREADAGVRGELEAALGAVELG